MQKDYELKDFEELEELEKNNSSKKEAAEIEDTKVNEDESKTKVNNQSNEFFKQKRLQEKEEKRIREEGRRQGLLESIKYHNPYTDEDIEDDADIEEYLTMKEMSDKGLDPIKDYSKYLKSQKKKELTKQSVRFSEETDIMNFHEEFPKTNLDEVLHNEEFINLFGTSIGTVPLTTLWRAFQNMEGKTLKSNAERQKEEIRQNRVQNQPGSFGGTTKKTATHKDFAKMSDEEFAQAIVDAKRGVYESQN